MKLCELNSNLSTHLATKSKVKQIDYRLLRISPQGIPQCYLRYCLCNRLVIRLGAPPGDGR